MANKHNLAGEIFGQLQVIGKSKKKNKSSNHLYWFVLCSCGNISCVMGQSLIKGDTKSCGCLSKKHGKSLSPEYQTWLSIKRRCYAKNHCNYEYYGGRGITVCKRWKNNFINFFNDMGEKPDKLATIERINNNKDYSPENCYWCCDKSIQSYNQRSRQGREQLRGTIFDKKTGKWIAAVYYKGKRYYLGLYSNQKDARQAYLKKAEEIYGVY